MTEETMARGAEGPEVAELQAALIALDFKPGEVDGVFGPITESAVKSFQVFADIEPDGIVDDETRQKLEDERGLPDQAGPS